MLLLAGVFLIIVGLACGANAPCKDCCLYKSCPTYQDNVLNVHLICHTHDDAGWLKTVDQYFWGANQSISPAGVQYILDNVIQLIQEDPRKRFTYVESGFFWRWWNRQHDVIRHQVDDLVANGQLEFVGGGWVSNDEATAHYTAIIDQMSYGLKFLNETFGDCARPRVAWQIDPFGHSKEQAALFAQMGYDATFFARIHYNDRKKRRHDQSMEMNWKASDDLGSKGDIFAGVFYEHYMPPDGFCFDEFCDDEPMMDDKRLDGYNVDRKVEDFVKQVQQQAKAYKTKHVLLTMGGDFNYMNPDKWYSNLDILIGAVNSKYKGQIKVFYSSPHCYYKAVKDSGIELPEKTDDFYPYATAEHSYWTGFYSSRPTFKRFIRQMNNWMQVCKQVDAVAALGPSDFGDLDVLREAASLSQHHDGVSGTAKQHVTNDYAKRLYRGFEECAQVFNDAAKNILPRNSSQSAPPTWTFCPYLNESACNVSQTTKAFTVSVFNGVSHSRQVIVRIPVATSSGYTVTGPDGATVEVQMSTIDQNPQVPRQGSYELAFLATVPPIGFSTYFVKRSSSRRMDRRSENWRRLQPASHRADRRPCPDDLATFCLNGGECVVVTNSDTVEFSTRAIYCQCAQSYFGSRCEYRDMAPLFDSEDVSEERSVRDERRSSPVILENQFVRVLFDDMGRISSVLNLDTGITLSMKQDWHWYAPATNTSQPSGAYIFRPNTTTHTPYLINSGPVRLEKKTGVLFDEVHQRVTSWVTQIVRLYKGQPYIEFEWTVGPIPTDNATLTGKEIVWRYESEIQNAGVFFTDANGRQLMQRKRNYQPTYDYDNTEPIAGNYYPATVGAYLKDDKNQLTILTDRSQGVSSPQDGMLEFMVHRRLLMDDGFGVNEALNETGADGDGLVARGRHWMILSTPSTGARSFRHYAQEMFYEPILAFSTPKEQSMSDYKNKYVTQMSGLTKELPPNVNMLTIEQWHASRVIIRLEHIYQKNEDSTFSQEVTVDLNNLFSTFDIVSMEEMTLGANIPLSDQEPEFRPDSSGNMPLDDKQVTLQPMQIRTFRLSVNRKELSV